ncbi:ankyrin repeat domain-containing protein 52 [Plakobranchus ocellatus]|uniref:Ankyrin repeat domain-containing protein 52 n=1 Tax=Plakobranchus ocellatus TaxID=259542 RepID=A0AAV3ZUZ7_9GAST|nr:ankyrin repeat domain-containing protein 52 [Plakobranchus ocellatus]
MDNRGVCTAADVTKEDDDVSTSTTKKTDTNLLHKLELISAARRNDAPAIRTAEAGLENFVSLLLEAGADVNVRDFSGQTPLMLAGKHGHGSIVQLLLAQQAIKVDEVDSEGRSALFYATLSGNINIAKTLLQNRAYPNLKDRKGETSLIHATKSDSLPLVELLLAWKSDVDAADNRGHTALMRCAGRTSSNQAILERLVEAKADVNCQNMWNETALMFACRVGTLTAVQFLTESGATLNAANVWGETPLMYAAEQGHHNIVELLIRRGSNVNETDINGATALMHSVISLRSVLVIPPLQCIPKTLKHCNDIYNCRRDANNPEQEKVVISLIDAGSDVAAKNCFGQTALMLAAMHGKARLVDVFLKKVELLFGKYKGITSYVRTFCDYKWTALSYAALGGHSHIISTLLNYVRLSLAFEIFEEFGNATNIAVVCDYPDIVNMLSTNCGAPGGYFAKYFRQSLINSCKTGKVDSAKALLNAFSANYAYSFTDNIMTHGFWSSIAHGHAEVASLFDRVYDEKISAWLAFIYGRLECLDMIHKATSNSSGVLRPWTKMDSCDNCVEPSSPPPRRKKTKRYAKISKADDAPLPHLLFDAIALGDIGELKSLLAIDPKLINACSLTGLTALSYACLRGNKDAVGELLAQGARVDKIDIAGCTPLMYAARFGHAGCVQLLLSVRCNIRHRVRAWTALALASQMGKADVVEMLLTAGAEISKTSKLERSPLQAATVGSHTRIIQTLINKGFDINSPGEEGQTPLIYAARFGDDRTAELLIDLGADVDYPDPKGRTALSWASERGNSKIVNALLDAGCSIIKADKHGQLPIWHAAKNGYPEVVEQLLEYNAFPSSFSIDRLPPTTLHPRALTTRMRARHTPADTVNNASRRDGSTALMHISGHGFHHTAAYLCGKGAKTDLLDSSGQTALHVAAKHNRQKTCNLLLVYGARSDIRDKDGNTPLLLALSNGHLKLLPLLEDTSMYRQEESEEDGIQFGGGDSASKGIWISFKSRLRLSFKRRNTHHSGNSRSIQATSRRRAQNPGADATSPPGYSEEKTSVSKCEEKTVFPIQNTTVYKCCYGGIVSNPDPCERSNLSIRRDPASSEPETCNEGGASSDISQIEGDPGNCSPTNTAISPCNAEAHSSALSPGSYVGEDLLCCHGSIIYPVESHENDLDQECLFDVERSRQNFESHQCILEDAQSNTCLESSPKHCCMLHKHQVQQPTQRCCKHNPSQQLPAPQIPGRHQQQQNPQQLHKHRSFSDSSHANAHNSLAIRGPDGVDPRENPEQGLDIESMTKTTIQTAVDRCLQQLPAGFSHQVVRGATSCNTTAVASISQESCGCGGPSLVVNLNQVFHVNPRVKKKKIYRPKALKIGRAKYLTTGKFGKIQIKSSRRRSKHDLDIEGQTTSCESNEYDEDGSASESETTDAQEDSGDSDVSAT